MRIKSPLINYPKGPSHTKNTKESQFGTGTQIRYRDKNTLRRLLRNACFQKDKQQKNGTKTTAMAKYSGFWRHILVWKGPLGSAEDVFMKGDKRKKMKST